MKKIKLIISLLIINFSVYSQTIPTAEQFLNFLKENNYTCNSIDYEEVYSNYGYDVEDDVSELINAIDSYCKYLIPNYFEEFQKIRTASDNLIKTLKSNDFKYLNYTSLLAFTIFQDIGVVPNEVKIEAADNTRPPYSAFYDGFIGKIPGDNNSYNGILGDKYPGFSFIQTSHDFSKKLDEFEVGDKSRILAFINSNDELIKQIIYNIYFEKVDDERVWKISDFEKEIRCRFGKDEFGKCVDKVDKSNTTIKEDKVDISVTKFKRGQYKVFLNEIDEQAASGAQNKNDYVNITEIILNISDDINGIYSYTSWGYDSQSCEFSSGEIKNENTIGFTLECLSEGSKYDAGSYSIEIIDEGTLRWKSDDGRFEKVFNYTFIPEE